MTPYSSKSSPCRCSFHFRLLTYFLPLSLFWSNVYFDYTKYLSLFFKKNSHLNYSFGFIKNTLFSICFLPNTFWLLQNSVACCSSTPSSLYLLCSATNSIHHVPFNILQRFPVFFPSLTTLAVQISSPQPLTALHRSALAVILTLFLWSCSHNTQCFWRESQNYTAKYLGRMLELL